MRCENYIDEFHRCWNRAIKLAIVQQQKIPNQQQRRLWICEGCFKEKLLNDRKFSDQILQVTNLSKNKNNDTD